MFFQYIKYFFVLILLSYAHLAKGSTLEGTVFQMNGMPAKGTLVKLRSSGFAKDTSPLNSTYFYSENKDTKAEENGLFRFDSIKSGFYNLELIKEYNGCSKDSIFIFSNDTTIVLPSDTLRPFGEIRGILKSGIPRDSLLSAFVIAVGFDRLVKVDRSGTFTMAIPEGIYTLMFSANKSYYVNMFLSSVRVISGNVTYIDPIYLISIQTKYKHLPTPVGNTFDKKTSFSYDLKGRMIQPGTKCSKGIFLRAKEKIVYLNDINRQ